MVSDMLYLNSSVIAQSIPVSFRIQDKMAAILHKTILMTFFERKRPYLDLNFPDICFAESN